jgi:predicted small metal-binding protein
VDVLFWFRRHLMSSELHMVECAPECGFKVQDHNTNELTEIVKLHGKTSHGKTFTDKEVQGMMKPVRA